MGGIASARRVKHTWVDAGGASSMPSQPNLTLVYSVLLGMCACLAGAWMTYLPCVLQVPLSSLIARAVVPTAAGSSSLDAGDVEPPSKSARLWSFLLTSTQYVCGAEFCGMSFLFQRFGFRDFK
jgi:hypothetical protein